MNNKQELTTNINNNSPSEQMLTNLSQGKNLNDNDIIKQAYKQKEDFEKLEEQREREDKERSLRELNMLRENTMIKNQLKGLQKSVENMQYESMIKQEIDSQRALNEAPLTADQIISNTLSEVIRERKDQALEAKRRKDEQGGNIFYI
ncbi:MAG: hypothetical protein LBR43_03415 [Spiroplasmataceae bacterium]|jgi:ATP/maltotriose-dependent transcriptional regulator MalT|nr:hypothetical protein [Spiroplasmataceae bacterium]